MDFLELIKKKIVIFDGAMGTSIAKKGIDTIDFKGKVCNEYINILNPNFIKEIHESFLCAGADIIETNTFGALPYLLKEFNLSDQAEEINRAGVNLALDVVKKFTSSDKPRYVSGSIGPGTKLPTLLQISFEELYHDYFLQAECLISEGVHLIQIETGQDPLQIKIALKAVLDVKKKLKKDIPVFLQCTIQDNGYLLVGMDLLTFINTFKDMPIHGLGINCGTGPHKIEPFVKILSENCPLNIIVLPNAGLPVIKDGKLTYDLTPLQFGETCRDLVRKYRINGIGGCCGTTSEFIEELANQISRDSNTSVYLDSKGFIGEAYLTSLYSSQDIKTLPAPLLIGERANVNGSKKFKNLLVNNDWEAMVEACIRQQDEGAHVLDINLAHLDRNEANDMASFIPLLNKTLTAPLMIDSSNFSAIETALKYTSGKVIVNSTNFEHGEDEVVKFIELSRNMNAALICLTIDEDGMAKTKDHKLKIVNRFINLCERLCFPRNCIFIDCLTFALSSGDAEYRNTGKEAIETIKYIKTHLPEINTIMGVSNVSFGLNPKTRKILNSVFLNECVSSGLTAAIVDSSKILPINDINDSEIQMCRDLIYNNDLTGDPLLKVINLTFDDDVAKLSSSPSLAPVECHFDNRKKLFDAVIKGRIAAVDESIAELLKTMTHGQILNDILLPAMKEVGVLFEAGKIQLPFVLKSAETIKKSVDIMKFDANSLAGDDSSLSFTGHNSTMLLATVQGDVHDIGKNLVQIILENNGYKVYDIGVKQSPTDIYQAILKYNPSCLGMSALLIKSTEYMKETLQFLKSRDISIPVICGGAALNKDFVENDLQKEYDGNVYYGKDAFAGLKFIQVIGSSEDHK